MVSHGNNNTSHLDTPHPHPADFPNPPHLMVLDHAHPLPPHIERIFTFANQRRIPIILGADTNAHSPLWGDNRLDARGTQIEDLLLNKNISLLNTGIEPTFLSTIGSSHIDITGVSDSISHLFCAWTCGNSPSHSDHQLISFCLNTPQHIH